MLPKFKSETLTAIVIIVLLLLQFVLAMTGHRKIESDLITIAAYQTQPCSQAVSVP
jgi:hypothetical protein